MWEEALEKGLSIPVKNNKRHVVMINSNMKKIYHFDGAKATKELAEDIISDSLNHLPEKFVKGKSERHIKLYTDAIKELFLFIVNNNNPKFVTVRNYMLSWSLHIFVNSHQNMIDLTAKLQEQVEKYTEDTKLSLMKSESAKVTKHFDSIQGPVKGDSVKAEEVSYKLNEIFSTRVLNVLVYNQIISSYKMKNAPFEIPYVKGEKEVLSEVEVHYYKAISTNIIENILLSHLYSTLFFLPLEKIWQEYLSSVKKHVEDKLT